MFKKNKCGKEKKTYKKIQAGQRIFVKKIKAGKRKYGKIVKAGKRKCVKRINAGKRKATNPIVLTIQNKIDWAKRKCRKRQ